MGPDGALRRAGPAAGGSVADPGPARQRLTLDALVVAGTASGVGKTSVATGILAALRAAGHRPQGFKVGPDFIDPSFHALASGRAARNLDVWLSGEDLVVPLLRHACAAGQRAADIAVVEGVMGMFDGAEAGTDMASTAHVARLLGAPVLLVVDAGAMARSAAAVVHGYATFDPRVRVAGVVFNRVGSPGHAELLREAVAPTGVPVVACLPEVADLTTPSRHLGLVPAAELGAAATTVVEALGAWVAAHTDVEALVALARTASVPDVPAWSPHPSPDRGGDGPDRPRRPVVAVAGGAAFTFRYTENLEVLEAAGATLATIDPLVDEALPESTAALYLGGGFPEVQADALSANAALAAQVRGLIAAGRPVVAECGGLLALCRTLDGVAQVGAVPADATMTAGLRIGYREAVAAVDSVLWRAGEVVRAQEFHRSTVDPPAPPPDAVGGDGPVLRPAWRIGDREEGFAGDGVHASYLHTHWAATPHVGGRIVAAATR